MNNKDLDTLLRLTEAFEKETKEVKVPDAIKPEAMTEKLRTVKVSENKGTIINMKRYLSIAATFIIVAVIAFLARTGFRQSSVERKSAFADFKENLVQKFSSDDEAKEAIDGIISSGKDYRKSSTEETGEETTEKTKVISRLFSDSADEKDEIVVENSAEVMGTKQEAVTRAEESSSAMLTSGNYLFILESVSGVSSDGVIRIVKNIPPEEMAEVAEITLFRSSASDSSVSCQGIYITGKTLIAVMKKAEYGATNSITTIIRYYDISNPEAPVNLQTQTYVGSCVYSGISDGKFFIVTGRDLTAEDSENGLICSDYAVVGNAKEKAVLTINATEITATGVETSEFAFYGCSTNASVTAKGNGIYITRVFTSVDTEARRTEIYSFAYNDGRISETGTASFDGTPASVPGITDKGTVMLIITDGSKLTAKAFTAELSPCDTLKNFASGTPTEVDYKAEEAYVTVNGETIVVNFADPGTISASANRNMTNVSYLTTLAGGNILTVSKAASGSVITITSGRETCSFETPYALTATDKSFACSADGTVFGFPAEVTDDDGTTRSVFVLFTVKETGIEFLGTYIHEDNPSDGGVLGAVISGDTLFTYSKSKVSAFSTTEKTNISSCSFN